MKILNNILTTTSVTAHVVSGQVSTTNEEASFPRSNLLEVNQAKVWKPTASITGQIVLTIPEGYPQSSAFFVGNTNALTVDWSASATVTNPDVTSGSWEPHNDMYEMHLQESFKPMSTMFVELTGHEGDVTVTLDFNTGLSAIDNLEVGIVQAGWVKKFSDIEYGLTEGLKDTNIYKRLSDGSEYVKERTPMRTRSGKTRIHLSEMDLFSHYAKTFRASPTVIIMNDSERRSMMFGKFSSTPRITRNLPEHHEVQMDIEEQL